MAHELTRLIHSITSEPQLITPAAYASVLEVLKNREYVEWMRDSEQNRKELAAKLIEQNKPEMAFELLEQGVGAREPTLSPDGKIGQIDVMGALAHRATAFEGLCGGRSYQSLVSDVRAVAAVDSVETIVLNIDSGGGEASGAFDTARTIKAIAAEAGKELVVYSDGLIASAAYALACVADRVVISESASVGSIGVITSLTSQKERLEKEGVEVIPVYAGKNKAVGNPALEISDEDVAIVQERVDTLFGLFADLVSENRDISLDSIVDMEASVFLGQEALERGLVDELMSADEFRRSLGETTVAFDMPTSNINLEESTVDNTTLETQGGEQLAAMEEKLAAMEAAMQEKDAALATQAEALSQAEEFLKEKAEAEATAKLEGFKAQAESWASLGVDAEQFAALAMDANSELVSMMSTALDNAMAQKESSVLLEEQGTDGEGEGELTEAERMVAFIKKQRNL